MAKQTVIEAIEKGLTLAYRHVGCYDDGDYQIIPDAREALVKVEAVAEALRRRALAMEHIARNLRSEEVSVSLEADDLDSEAAKARAALAKFTEEATHDHAPGFPAHEHLDGEPPLRIVDSSQSS